MAMVDNQASLHSVYNYYQTAYAPMMNNTGRYDTHKKSELRSVYNSIIKQSKESPTYIIDTSSETKAFAVGVKEGARQFSNVISSLSSGGADDMLSRRVASSTDESAVSAKYIGDSGDSRDTEVQGFDIKVKRLAAPQVNDGSLLKADAEVGLEPGTYSFDIRINGSDYEFQFGVNEKESNLDLQQRLSALINRSNIGVNSSVIEEDGRSAISLESLSTGRVPGRDLVFEVSDANTSKKTGAVSYLGIGSVTSQAENAVFDLNGIERSAYSNTFTVDKRYEVTLRAPSQEDKVAHVGIKPDVESMTDNVHQLAAGYNDFIGKARSYSGSNVRTDTFMSDMWRTNRAYMRGLSNLGITFSDVGDIEVDDEALKESFSAGAKDSGTDILKGFTKALMRKSSQISLDPMNYVQKTVVAYKNPGRSFSNPYMTSIYSGMLFNSYC